MRIFGDDLSYHNMYDECYEDGLFCCYFMIGFCWSIEYQIQGMDNDQRLGEKKRDLSLLSLLSLSLPLSPSPSLCVCTYLYIYSCSFPSNLTFTFTFTYTKFQINNLFNHTLRYLPYPTIRKTVCSPYPIPYIHSPMYCTAPYLQYVDST